MGTKAREMMTLPALSLVAHRSFASAQQGTTRTQDLMAPALPFLIVFAAGILTIILFRRKE
jgi:hypothetical protein